MAERPVPFALYRTGVYLHGTKAELAPGALLIPGRRSNYGVERTARHVYVTATLDAATWGAELAAGEGRGHIYVVEPTGALEDDPNVTDKRFAGNPTMSYRTQDPVRVVEELSHWRGHNPAQVRAMREHLAALEARGGTEIDD
ncbi:MAG: NAD(+)--rifampin ADP-ribosyltransferase [Demequina sp.]